MLLTTIRRTSSWLEWERDDRGGHVVHPGVERVTLVEIEPQVLRGGPDLRRVQPPRPRQSEATIVLNDGRNFLMTTAATFDVITADPIHPWFRGAGYLYASEYFELAAAHLRPGGVIAQWLPIYELTPQDLASVVKTFQQHFPHTLMWLTHYDAVLVGSNSPFLIDEAELQRRIAEPAVAADLKKVLMGSATDLLSYFVMGTEGMKRFAQNGTVNTDDRPLPRVLGAVLHRDTRRDGGQRRGHRGPTREHPALPEASGQRRRPGKQQRERWDRQLAAGKSRRRGARAVPGRQRRAIRDSCGCCVG